MDKILMVGIVIAAASIVSFVEGRGDSHRAPLPHLRWPIAVIAHRAGAGIAPENTLAAIRQAIRLRADYVELDVRTTKDGAFVIMHDSRVDRTTDGHGAVRDLTLAEIRALHVKNEHAKQFDGEKVPTYDEALSACRGRVNLYLDHKDADTAALFAALKKHGMEKSALVYNGVSGVNEWKRIAPHIPVMPSLPDEFRRPGGIADFEKICPAEALDGHFREWTPELVREAHAAGVKVYVDIMGPDDNPDGYARAIAMGVDGIQTDHPDRLTAFLGDYSKPAFTP
jgi:glycerophosphoryl diester phosphodiesterase